MSATDGFECYFERIHGMHAWRIEILRRRGFRTLERAVRPTERGPEFQVVDEGASMVDVPPFLVLDHRSFMALRDALVTEYDPPTESKALREALELERARVDRVLAARLP